MSEITPSNIELKTREDYLLTFETKLFETLKTLFQSINYNIIFAYGLASLVVMIQWGAVSELSLLGSKFSLEKQNIFTFVPLIVCAVYMIVNYQIMKIARVLRALNDNGKELQNLNPNAITITVKNANLFFEGVTGFILSFARWQANILLKKRLFRFNLESVFRDVTATVPNFFIQLVLIIIRVLLVTAVFYFPVFCLAYYQLNEFYLGKPFSFRIPTINDAAFLIVIITIIFTTICCLFLFSIYLIDLIETYKEDLQVSGTEISKSFLGDIVESIARSTIKSVTPYF